MMKRCTTVVVVFALGLLGFRAISYAADADVTGKLIVFHAGSLAVPFRQISAAFKQKHPGVHIILEAAGSRACARKISDLRRPCDVFASADYTVIDNLLVPEHAGWNIRFASNEMTLVFRDESRLAKTISARNWFEILARANVAFGRSDPNADPCGYRAVLTMKLAEKYYQKPGLAATLLKKDLKYIRPKETDLLALLEIGEIDYVFLYRSVAEQHGLRRLLLPTEINLKDPGLATVYRMATVKVTGKTPGTTIAKHGTPMVYGVTMPRNAANPQAALAFLSFLLEADHGMAIMVRNGQPSVVPAPTSTFDEIPGSLKRFAVPEIR